MSDEERIEQLEDALHQVRSWCRAYPRTVFIEPTREMWAKAAQVLKETEGCPSLDAISGSNMRRVVEGVQKIIDEALPVVQQSSEPCEHCAVSVVRLISIPDGLQVHCRACGRRLYPVPKGGRGE